MIGGPGQSPGLSSEASLFLGKGMHRNRPSVAVIVHCQLARFGDPYRAYEHHRVDALELSIQRPIHVRLAQAVVDIDPACRSIASCASLGRTNCSYCQRPSAPASDGSEITTITESKASIGNKRGFDLRIVSFPFWLRFTAKTVAVG